jgi:hypothetical protein
MGMKRILYVVIVVIALCLVALSACSGAGPPGEPVTKVEDVFGVWHRTKRFAEWERGIYMRLRADGTMGFSPAPDSDYEWATLDFAFEGTRLSVTETAFRGWGQMALEYDVSCATGLGAPSGAYEMELLANGNLKFVNPEDGCKWRREMLTLAEWAPVQ